MKSSKALTEYLTQNVKSDQEKVRSIYLWICENIKYDYKASKKSKPSYFIPDEVLRKSKAICSGYSNLFRTMCNDAGLQCSFISGYAKRDGKINNDYMGLHAWNAVKIDSNWRLMDLTWASGYIKPGFQIVKFKKFRNDKWYLTNPKEFILRHLPEDPMWQLLSQPVSMKLFKKDDQVIYNHFRQSRRAYRFNDSIAKWSQHSFLLQRYYSCERAYRFNKKNNFVRALGLYSFALYSNSTITGRVNQPSSYSRRNYETYLLCIENYNLSLKYLNKARAPNKKIKEHFNELKISIQDGMIANHRALAKLAYLKINDSLLTIGTTKIKAQEKEIRKQIKYAEKTNRRLGRMDNFQVEMADYFYIIGTSIGNAMVKGRSTAINEAGIKTSSYYLLQAKIIYKRAGKKKLNDRINSCNILIERLKELP